MPLLNPHEILYLRQWLEVADLDLAAAERMFADYGYHIPFACQQAVEKYSKGVLLSQSKAYRKTHDLPALLQQLTPALLFTNDELDDADLLSDFAVDSRYPPNSRIGFTEMQEALRITRHLQSRLRPYIVAALS
jgi:HEPN domain-containing protein